MSKRLGTALTALLILLWVIWFPFSNVYAESAETQIQEIPEDIENPLQAGDPETDEGKDPLDTDMEEPDQTVGSPDTEDGGQIIQVYAARSFDPNALYFLETGGDAGTIPLETIAWAQYGRFDFVECEIVWRYDEFDNITPGRRMIVGDIVLPTGYAFQDETLTVQSPVIVYDPDCPPTEKLATCIYIWPDKPILIPLGAGRETLPDYFVGLYDTADLITENGDIFSCPVTLDLDVIDTSRAGVYYPIVLELPGGVTFGGQEFYMTGVHVVPDDEVDLRAVKWWRNGYIITWLYPSSEPVLWAAVDGEDWFLPETWSDGTCNTYGYFSAVDEDRFNELVFLYNNLPTGHVYKFQVQYDGDRFSNVVELDLVNNSLPKNYFDYGGDRTGGDRGENTLPLTNSNDGTPSAPPTNPGDKTLTAPPTNSDDEMPTAPSTNSDDGTPSAPPINPGDETPTTPPVTAGIAGGTPVNNNVFNAAILFVNAPQTATASETPSSARPAEYSDENSVTVSGERLAVMMAANKEYVSFMRGELRASLPVAYLENLDLNATDAFTVILYQPDEQSFAVAFAVNDNPLTDQFSEPFLVSLPWQSGPVSCTSPSGESVDAIPDGGRATFSLHRTGAYALTEQTVTAMAIAQSTDLPPGNAITPVNDIPLGKTAAESAGARPYSDGFAPVAVVGSISLAGVLVFLHVTRKRRLTRP